MSVYQPDGRNRTVKRLADEARRLAVTGQWEEALETNRRILQDSPREVEALNRVGKALSELNRFEEALATYQEVLAIDAGNLIAHRNVARLEQLMAYGPSGRQASTGIRANVFVEEVGKTYVTDLIQPGAPTIICVIAPADQLGLRVEGEHVKVVDGQEQQVGYLEPRVAKRLIALMEYGNQYEAFVVALTGNTVRIILREAYRNPETPPALVLPRQAKIAAPRPYLRDMTRIRRELEPDLLLDTDEEDEEDTEEDIEDIDTDELGEDETDDDEYIEPVSSNEDEEEEPPL